ncbi:hypothetical protein FRC15_010080 [Serendipita sp. 397]|nr:hypothetical protein FRC15_010080 [Serendipita sp. 397]
MLRESPGHQTTSIVTSGQMPWLPHQSQFIQGIPMVPYHPVSQTSHNRPWVQETQNPDPQTIPNLEFSLPTSQKTPKQAQQVSAGTGSESCADNLTMPVVYSEAPKIKQKQSSTISTTCTTTEMPGKQGEEACQIAFSIKPKQWKKAEVQSDPPLSAFLRGVLRQYCEGHSVLPSLDSRKKWAALHNVAANRVHHYCSGRLSRSRKDPKSSKDAWELPSQISTEEVKVKEESIEESMKNVEESTSRIDCESPMSLGSLALDVLDEKPVPFPILSPSCDPKTPVISEDARTESVPPLLTPCSETRPGTVHLEEVPLEPSTVFEAPTNTNPSMEPNLGPISLEGPPVPSNESSEPARHPSDLEIIAFLVENNFFVLVTGPNAVTMEDMVDRERFVAKLSLHNCNLDPYFVWRTLRRFYYFF